MLNTSHRPRVIMRKAALTTVLTAIALLILAPEAAAQESSMACQAIPTLMQRFLANHVSVQKQDDALVDKVVDLYVDRLDPTRSLLTASEYDKLRKDVKALYTDVEVGKCERFEALHKKEVKLHKDMEVWVRKSLAKPVKIDETITLQVDPEKRERPKNAKELAALRNKLIQFQLVNYVKNGTAPDEAQKKLVHRYELITRRVSEFNTIDQYSAFLNAFANALDPHSTYFSPDDLEDFRISMDLALEGIGAVLSSRDGYTTVQEVVPGGAADRQGGLKTKDKIIAVAQGQDGESVDVIDMALRDVVRMIRGKKDTTVKLTILRQGERTERHELLITRDKIDLKEQAAKLRWEEVNHGGKKMKLAIIDLPSFYGGRREAGARNCTDDVRELLDEANKKGADGVLLDLSRNGGGLLQAAVDISGFFVARGPIVSVEGPSSRSETVEDTDPRIHYNGPLVVLTSLSSASASEILAGALKDYRRAVIVGDVQTYGKGTVQNIINLPTGFGALKITTALFFIPGGTTTQSAGVAADVVVPSLLAGQDFGERFQPNALPAGTIPPFRGRAINSDDTKHHFAPLTDDLLTSLSKRSAARIAADEEFKKLAEETRKFKANEGVVKLADILADKAPGDDETTEEDKPRTDELTPQAKEALRVLADLADLQRSTAVGKK